MNLYFESSAGILFFVSLGKHLESNAKKNTSNSINEYLSKNKKDIIELWKELNFIMPKKTEVAATPFNGKSVAVTGKLIHFTRDSINAKLESLEKKELFKFKVSILNNNNIINKAEYLDGKIYFTLDISEMVPTGSALVSAISRYLYVIDTGTEECNKLLDTEVDEFFLDENKIYYFPPADPTLGYFHIARSNDIHECDLDGKNDRVIYSNSDIFFLGGDIVNRKLFGSFAGYIPGINSDVFYASLDLETGEIKEVDLPE